MSEKKYSTIQQHEPLRTPAGWSLQEKRFVAQLEEVLDDIYRRFGRLKMSDLGPALKNTVMESSDGVKNMRTEILQTAEKIELKADKTIVDDLGEKVSTFSTTISQTAEEIKLLARKEALDALTGKVEKAETSITQTAEAISMIATKEELDALGNTISEHGTFFQQTAEKIEAKASQTDLNDLGDKVGKHETTISQTAEAISLIATEEELNALKGTVSQKGTFFTQTAEEFRQKASLSDFNELGEEVSKHETTISQTADKIALIATDAEWNELKGTVAENGTFFTQTSDKIALIATAAELDELGNTVSEKGTFFAQTAGKIALIATEAELNALGSTVGEKGTFVTQTAAALEQKAEKQVVDPLVGKVSSFETTIKQTSDAIALIATEAELNALGQSLGTKGTFFAQTVESISVKASKEVVDHILDGTTGVPKVLNSTMTIDANGIRMTGGVISLSAETSLLLSSGGKVDINGASGSIDLGSGSQISADNGSFKALLVNGVPYMPIIFSSTQPTQYSNCYWAQPVSVESVQATMPTPENRSPQEGGFTTNHGTPTNKHVYTMAASTEVLVGNSFDYTFKIPLYRADSGSTTKTLWVSITRGASSITFPAVQIAVAQYAVVWATFTLTGSVVNLFSGDLVGYDFDVAIWSDPVTSYNVYVQRNNTATLTGKVKGATGAVQQCVLNYIPGSG